jgi:hypothetical protein
MARKLKRGKLDVSEIAEKHGWIPIATNSRYNLKDKKRKHIIDLPEGILNEVFLANDDDETSRMINNVLDDIFNEEKE